MKPGGRTGRRIIVLPVGSIEDNVRIWNDAAYWPTPDPWSAAWGDAQAQWFGSVFPRLRHNLPAQTILEIAPGHGRWTQFLRQHCDRLIGVDVSERCVTACRARFAGDQHLTFHVNDGCTLPMIPVASVDFVFSFDSLVHAELDVLHGYVTELARILTRTGVAFLHHSNLHDYLDPNTAQLPPTISNPGWRAATVSAALVRGLCASVGLRCVRQELVNWGGRAVLNDAFTVIARGTPDAETVVLQNPDFMTEARIARTVAAHYSPAPRSVKPGSAL